MFENQNSISVLSPEIIQKILKDTSDKTIANFRMTSRRSLFQTGDLFEKRAASILLEHVIKGEEAQALNMIAANPQLLLRSSEALSYSSKPINGTAYQAALRIHDVQMARKMEVFFSKLPNGNKIKEQQYKDAFPNGLPCQKSYDFTNLVQALYTCTDEDADAFFLDVDNNSNLHRELKKFRNEFTALSMQEDCNPTHLIKSLKVFANNFNGWTYSRQNVFESKVIGFIQRFLSPYYAQALCQGLKQIVQFKHPLERLNQLPGTQGTYFPLQKAHGYKVSYMFYIEPINMTFAGAKVRMWSANTRLRLLLEELVEQTYLELSSMGMVNDDLSHGII